MEVDMLTVAEASVPQKASHEHASPESIFRSIVELALSDRKEPELKSLQGEIDAMATKAVMANFEPFRDAAEDLLRVLRVSYGQVARFVEGDFRQDAGFYLGQLHVLAEIADKVRQRRLSRDVIELVMRNQSSMKVLRVVLSSGSIGASELANKVGMKESNLSTLCTQLVDREILRADRYGRRVRYSPTPLTHAVVAHLGAQVSSAPAGSAMVDEVTNGAPDWSKCAAAAAAASFDVGNVMANTSDFASVILTLGLLRDAKAVVIELPGNEVRIESKGSQKEARLRLPKSVGFSLLEQMNACTVYRGANKSEAKTLVFDWCGQKLRATYESSEGNKAYRIEFLDSVAKKECRDKVQTAFQEIGQEKSRLEDFIKFYARQVTRTFDNKYPLAAKTLGIRVPELKSILDL
jgi:DNA-binding MarR family transcriptional regulator